MTADIDPGRGLGWVESPDDPRDWPLSALYSVTGTDVPVALPASYHVPAPLYPVLDQGSSPMCVAYSAAAEQGWFDLRDSGLALFDEPMFFKWIGGTQNGAVIRDALATRLSTGYPPQGHADQAGAHRIAAYYSVPVAQADLCAAILSFGPVVIGTPWYRRWFAPVNGVLGDPDLLVGGHAILAVGWDATGLRLRNSWGADWGQGGEATLPWSQLHYLREAWKAVDALTPKPPQPRPWRLRIAHGATVRVASVSASGCISGWSDFAWTGAASSAPCRQPVVKKGCRSGQATVAYVTDGDPRIRHRFVHTGTGVTASRAPLAASEEDPT